MGKVKKFVRKKDKGLRLMQVVQRKLKFPNCTEIYLECSNREEPCNTCPYKQSYKPKSKEEKNVQDNQEIQLGDGSQTNIP